MTLGADITIAYDGDAVQIPTGSVLSAANGNHVINITSSLVNLGRIAPSESLADTLEIVVNGDIDNRGQMGGYVVEVTLH
jgi:hypothetical protein